MKSFILNLLFLILVFSPFALIFYLEASSQHRLYDVEITAHYIDGANVNISKDSISFRLLPEIYMHHGGYILDFGGKSYFGVVRYEYKKKKSYLVDFETYFFI